MRERERTRTGPSFFLEDGGPCGERAPVKRLEDRHAENGIRAPDIVRELNVTEILSINSPRTFRSHPALCCITGALAVWSASAVMHNLNIKMVSASCATARGGRIRQGNLGTDGRETAPTRVLGGQFSSFLSEFSVCRLLP